VKFSLIIPCYNEAENLSLLFSRCKKLIERADIEVILVDNGSTDNSPEVLNDLLQGELACRSIRVEKNEGYGFGILSGLKAAKGDIIGWTHADLQTDPLDVLQAIKLFEKYGSNVFAKGRRYGRPLSDVIFTSGMSLFETILLWRPMWDINAQPTMFPRDFFDSWYNAPHDFSLDLYAYYQAMEHGLLVKRFPVLFGERAHGVSHWNINWAAKRKFIYRTINFSLELRKMLKK